MVDRWKRGGEKMKRKQLENKELMEHDERKHKHEMVILRRFIKLLQLLVCTFIQPNALA